MTINYLALPLYLQSFAARVIYVANGLTKRSATAGIVLSNVKDINKAISPDLLMLQKGIACNSCAVAS